MNSFQIIIIVSLLAAIGVLAFMMNSSIKKHEARKAVMKKKKGRTKYMPEVKKIGR